MGKKGDLLRAQKAQSASYTFTSAQLQEHDDFIRDEYRDKLRAKLEVELKKRYEEKEAEIAKYIKDEWDSREALFDSENFGINFMTIISMLLAVSSKVLVEQFGWTPIPKDGYFTKRFKLARFGDAVVSEINAICMDEQGDIRKYCDEVYEKYGVKFVSEDANEEAAGADTSDMS